MPKQVKSKERVAKHGEVFTNEREVNAMLDLVKDETLRIDSRFLEPACGDGNFLSKIIERKLEVVTKKYRINENEWEKYSLLALMSSYGVELMQDNVEICIERLYKIWEKAYKKYCKKTENDNIKNIARNILERNILCGNALTLKKVDENANDTEEPIAFTEWSFVTGDNVKMREFRFDELLKASSGEVNLIQMCAGWEYDEEVKEWIPRPIKEYDLIDYRKLMEAKISE